MRRLCSWCNTDFGSKPGPEQSITHGICPTCYTRVLAEEFSAPPPARLEEFLEALGVPVFLADDDVRVHAGNQLAASLVGKKLDELPGKYGGQVIECVNASRPGGCGKTILCRTCVIRNSVTDTFQTGKSHIRLPASRELATDEGVVSVRFVISTEKVGPVVLLRIDEVLPGG